MSGSASKIGITMSETPVGPRTFDFGKLSDEQFQEMCNLLVLLEFPSAQATADPDGGADTLLPKPTAGGGWERAWQAKHFTSNIRWAQCKNSLDDAVTNYKVAHVTFCFPRDLTHRQNLKFDEELATRHDDVLVDYWNATKLLSLLNGSAQGRRIADRYFGAPPPGPREILRAVRAGGELVTAEQALERGLATGEILSAKDPLFAYAGVQTELHLAVPFTSGTIMSIGATQDGVTVRYDAIPRGAVPPIDVRLTFEDSEDGRRAAAALEDALRRRQPVELTTGVSLSTTGAPGFFQSFVDSLPLDSLQITPEPLPPWQAVLEVATDLGTRRIEVLMEPISEPRDGYEAKFRGTHVGLTVLLKTRRDDNATTLALDWSYGVRNGTARAHLATLRFAEALHGEGSLTIIHKPTGTKTLMGLHRSQFPLASLVAFMEAVMQIEDWTREDITLPEEFPANDIATLATAAQIVQRRKIRMTWSGAEGTLPPDRITGPLLALHLQTDIAIMLFGNQIGLGTAVRNVAAVQVEDLGADAQNPAPRRFQWVLCY
ncbi:MAG: hypothetical protein ACLP8S_33770 [Solirubrobacteraceae bacterium]